MSTAASPLVFVAERQPGVGPPRNSQSSVHFTSEMSTLASSLQSPRTNRGPLTSGIHSAARSTCGRFFDDVRLERYDDALHVTDAEPLLAYLRSMATFPPFDDAGERLLREKIDREIRRRGAFHVTKDTGLYSARVRRPT